MNWIAQLGGLHPTEEGNIDRSVANGAAAHFIHGGIVERYYREAPLMIIGEGTNEMQKLIIARRLLQQYAI